ncbi:MAG: rRNA maturation RNase YbeY [Acidimicrobiia bacterium]|mgnify:CR=1 FL=1
MLVRAVEVFVANEQSDEEIDLERIRMLAEEVLLRQEAPEPTEVSVICVDEASMRSLSQRFLGIDEATDVLAFPIDGEVEEETVETAPGGRVLWPEDGPVLLGDVVICPAVTRRYAEENQKSFQSEIDLVVVHGLLHLLGYDHATKDEEAVMNELQNALLDNFYSKLEEASSESGAGT